MSVQFRTTITWARSPRGMGKAFKQARPKALEKMAQHWFDKILPRHFTEEGKIRYRYHARDPVYEARKLRKFGHTKPLVWTGRMQEALMRNIGIVATTKRVTLELAKGMDRKWLKGYIAFKGRRGTGPDKWLEIKRIPSADAEEMSKICADVLREAIKNAKGNPSDMGVDL